MIEIPRHITKKDITERLGISASTLYRIRKNDPDFPEGIKVSERAVRFSEKKIIEWIEKKYSQQLEN